MDVSLIRTWIVKFIGSSFRVYIIGCVSIVTFGTLLFSGCANGGLGERSNSGARFIWASEPQPDRFGWGTGAAAETGAFVDWTKPANEQPGPSAPLFGGRGSVQ